MKGFIGMILRDYVPYFCREAKFKRAIYRQQKLYRRGYRRLAYFVHYYIYYKWHCEISCRAVIDPTVVFSHPIGIVIGDGTKLGKNTVVFQNVTFGQKNDKFPQVGEECVIYPNSVLIGDITISDRTIVGAGSVLLRSTEVESIYAGNPARRIDRKG